jgi:hypothetical protein
MFGLSGMQAVLRPSSPSNVMDWYAHPTPYFERNFVRLFPPCTVLETRNLTSRHMARRRQCSNFTCCGQSLADLHELVDHFEEAHVVVIGPDGYPSSRMGSNPDSPSPCHSVMPFAKAVLADHRTGISIETPGTMQSRCASAGHTLVAEFDAPPVDLTAKQLCLPPSSFMVEVDYGTEVQANHDDQSILSASPRMGKKRPRAHGVSKRRDKSHKCLVSHGVGNGGVSASGWFQVRMLIVMSFCCLAPRGLRKSRLIGSLAHPLM